MMDEMPPASRAFLALAAGVATPLLWVALVTLVLGAGVLGAALTQRKR